jgi:hypothetical protein
MNYLERMPSIIAFIPKEKQPTKPGTLGFMVNQLMHERKVVSTVQGPINSRKVLLSQQANERLLWQLAVLQDIRDQEQFRVMQDAGVHIDIPKEQAEVMQIPLFVPRAHDMPVDHVARILKDRIAFAKMQLDPDPKQYGNHFYSPESFAYAQDLLGRLQETASGTMIK